MASLYALIMAGGGGTRLWPESRSQHPKQFISLFGNRSLLQIAHDRITPLVPPERVLVVTGRRYAEIVKEQLPVLPAENIIVEPSGRNTAPAIGLGAIHLQRRDPEAVMAVLTADHLMRRKEVFRSAIAAAAEAAALSGGIVTLGITPAFAETGYGYIEQGQELRRIHGHRLYEVDRFREKPDPETAEAYLRSGRHYWNSGMFIWTVRTILSEIERQLPDLYVALQEIGSGLGTAQEKDSTETAWSSINPISVDFGIMEGAPQVAMLPVDPGWSDVGSWRAVYEEALAAGGGDAGGNVVEGGGLLALDTQNCLVRSSRLVGTVGVSDLIIVDTKDVLLVCHRSQAQQVRDLVQELRSSGHSELL